MAPEPVIAAREEPLEELGFERLLELPTSHHSHQRFLAQITILALVSPRVRVVVDRSLVQLSSLHLLVDLTSKHAHFLQLILLPTIFHSNFM